MPHTNQHQIYTSSVIIFPVKRKSSNDDATNMSNAGKLKENIKINSPLYSYKFEPSFASHHSKNRQTIKKSSKEVISIKLIPPCKGNLSLMRQRKNMIRPLSMGNETIQQNSILKELLSEKNCNKPPTKSKIMANSQNSAINRLSKSKMGNSNISSNSFINESNTFSSRIATKTSSTNNHIPQSSTARSHELTSSFNKIMSNYFSERDKTCLLYTSPSPRDS